jgi:hypothetical protein
MNLFLGAPSSGTKGYIRTTPVLAIQEAFVRSKYSDR